MLPRSDISFRSGGVRCQGWLYRPAPTGSRAPIVVLVHGIGGVREMRLDAYAERFQAAGFAALAIDYRGFGTSGGEPRAIVSIRRQQEDLAAAIAFARTLDGIDPDRVVLWGTSFGGGHVVQVAARDPRIAAVITQAGFTDGLASALALDIRSTLGAGALAFADLAARAIGRGPVLAPLVGTPGTPALMTAPDVVAGILEVLPAGSRLSRRLSFFYRRFAARRLTLPPTVTLSDLPDRMRGTRLVGSIIAPSGTTIPNGVAARIALVIPFWRPGRAFASLRCPVLVGICGRDSVAPPGRSRRLASRCPTAELHEYPVGHFDIYTGEAFEQVVADQVAFLERRVAVAAAVRD